MAIYNINNEVICDYNCDSCSQKSFCVDIVKSEDKEKTSDE